jgi:hypothetical protein
MNTTADLNGNLVHRKTLLDNGVLPYDVAKNFGMYVPTLLPLGTSLCARLTCFKFRFLRRSLHDVKQDRNEVH